MKYLSKSLLYKTERSLQSTTDVGILTEIITCTQKCGTISSIGDYNNIINHIHIGLMMEKNLCIIVGQSHTQKY
jgi:threonine dehydrogenase-like Zn-dependent dehydrogenase